MKIVNVRVVTPEEVLEHGAVEVAGGRIVAVQADAPGVGQGGQTVDGGGGTLLPGFIDLHNHGALGQDFMDGREDTLETMGRFLAAHGVTGFLATTTASTSAVLAGRLAAAGRRAAAPAGGGARCLGVHLEGPYLNPKLCGMHPPAHCRLPNPAEYRPWLDSGVVRRMTASLELPGGEALLADCLAAGVLLSLGHTACSAADVTGWARAGLRHATHLYNAMSRAEKRGPVRVCGCVEGCLVERGVTCEIIGDGWHVPEHLFRLAALCKGAGGITIASDATLLTGAAAEGVPVRYGGPDGQELVVRNGMAVSLDGTALVGSIATLGDMVPRLLAWLDGDWRALARMMSTNAAALIGLGRTKGQIRPGYDADLVLVGPDGNVRKVWVEGAEH
jgi:N-acetylglucosamine-6-phosphate deacetylase